MVAAACRAHLRVEEEVTWPSVTSSRSGVRHHTTPQRTVVSPSAVEVKKEVKEEQEEVPVEWRVPSLLWDNELCGDFAGLVGYRDRAGLSGLSPDHQRKAQHASRHPVARLHLKDHRALGYLLLLPCCVLFHASVDWEVRISGHR